VIHEVFRGDGAGGWRVARLVMAGQRMEGWEKGQGGGGGGGAIRKLLRLKTGAGIKWR